MTIEYLKSLEEVNQIKFTESEREQTLKIFSLLEQSENELSKIDVSGLESQVYVQPIYNVLREDKRVQPFSRESLLEGAPQRTEDSWQVPRLVK